MPSAPNFCIFVSMNWRKGLLALLAMSFLVRLVNITAPPLERSHSWRQATGLMVARNFSNGDSNILRPQIDERGLCPAGWHVPSESEWYELVSQWGGYSVAGETLKSTYGWSYSGQGTNTSGFNGMPGGKRQDGSGYFSSAGDKGTWWTSTPYSSLARYSELRFNSNGVTNSYADRETGYSVRCSKDDN